MVAAPSQPSCCRLGDFPAGSPGGGGDVRWLAYFEGCGTDTYYDGSNTNIREYPPFANSPLAKYSRNAFSMGLAGLPASCTHTNFGQKVDDSCCDNSSAIMSVPIQQAYGDYTVLPQGQVFQDGRGIGIYFNSSRPPQAALSTKRFSGLNHANNLGVVLGIC